MEVHILELLANAFDHSQSEVEATCLYTMKNKTFLDFCVVDDGQGIRPSFLKNPALRNFFESLNDVAAIEKATEFRITCNPKDAPNPAYSHKNGGIGLYFLRQFVELHRHSQLIIISHRGLFYAG